MILSLPLSEMIMTEIQQSENWSARSNRERSHFRKKDIFTEPTENVATFGKCWQISRKWEGN